jgi:hypothetical protein
VLSLVKLKGCRLVRRAPRTGPNSRCRAFRAKEAVCGATVRYPAANESETLGARAAMPARRGEHSCVGTAALVEARGSQFVVQSTLLADPCLAQCAAETYVARAGLHRRTPLSVPA